MDVDGFDGIEKLTVQVAGHLEQVFEADKIAGAAVGNGVAAGAKGADQVFNPNGGTEAREEHAAGVEDAPHFCDHLLEMGIVAGEMQHGDGEDGVEGVVWKGDVFNGFSPEVFRRQVGG